MKIQNHLLQGVDYIASPNVGGTIIPRFVVMHYTAGWDARSAINTLTSRASKVSAHFVVDRDGTITQLVPCNRVAWHAGPSEYRGVKYLNRHSIGIEIVNPGYFKQGGPTGFLDWSGKPIPTERWQQYDTTISGPNAKIGGGVFTWPGYAPEQIAAVHRLFAAICGAYDIEDVVGHEDIDTRGWKTDPGPAFPMGEFKRKLFELEGRRADEPRFGTHTVQASALNVRSKPSTSGRVLTILRRGAMVAVVEDKGEWSLIEYAPDQHGWIADRYIAEAA